MAADEVLVGNADGGEARGSHAVVRGPQLNDERLGCRHDEVDCGELDRTETCVGGIGNDRLRQDDRLGWRRGRRRRSEVVTLGRGRA